MEIKYQNPGFKSMIDSILQFQSDNETVYWLDGLYAFYPQLDKEYAKTLEWNERYKYISDVLEKEYDETKINEKVKIYNEYWLQKKNQINDALSEAFEIDCKKIYNNMICDVSMNPTSPRYLMEKRFEVFYLNSEKGAIGTSIHEMIHFAWFYVWNIVFQDDYDEYERPSLKWILSEMVVESIMKDERLSSINPYFPREHGGCVYSYFFDMEVGGGLILDKLDLMYKNMNIREFMLESYGYIRDHEQEIRQHIKEAEDKGW